MHFFNNAYSPGLSRGFGGEAGRLSTDGLFSESAIAGRSLFGISPVSRIQIQTQLLTARNHIIGGVHRRRRTGHIVESPTVPSCRIHASREVHHIKISQRFNLIGPGIGLPEIMRPSPGATIQIAGIVAHGGIIRRQKLNTRIQPGGNDRQRPSLTSAADADGIN